MGTSQYNTGKGSRDWSPGLSAAPPARTLPDSPENNVLLIQMFVKPEFQVLQSKVRIGLGLTSMTLCCYGLSNL